VKILLGNDKRGNWEAEVDDNAFMLNDVIFPWEFNPNRVRLWIITDEYGPIGAVWGSEHDALDIAADLGILDAHQIDDTTEITDEEDVCRLGNASEPFDIDYVRMFKVNFDVQPLSFIAKIAEARGKCIDHLGEF
jgi:hypothetical protein